MKRRIVLAAGWRTPWVKAGGALRNEDAARVGAAVARETLATSG
ncbi:MAG: acetyl-CoA C-acyltransferase, partial [Planctomycetaceae bacterium]|nr:acetyl-CoA C-acyltransferase [Planctomycetaceae bacterium]